MARQSENEQPPSADWTPCPPGEVARLGKKLHSRRQRRVFLRAGIAAAASLFLGGGAVWLWSLLQPKPKPDTLPDHLVAGIRCSEVRRLARAYLKGEIPEPKNGQITRHISRCPYCRPFVQAIKDRM